MRRQQCGLERVDDLVEARDLDPGPGDSDRLTVTIWLARDPRIVSDLPELNLTQEVA